MLKNKKVNNWYIFICMSDYSSIIEYDKKGRTVRVEVYEPAIIINYEYII